MKRRFNIIEAIEHPKIFRPLFGDLESWFSWIVFLKAVFGLEMDRRELELYRKCTNRSVLPDGGVKEAWAIVGRRGGKSRIVSFAAVFVAAFYDFSKHLARGETAMVLTLARDRDQARVTFGYIRGIIESVPALKAMVTAWRADEIELRNGITIGVKTADFRGIRGITVACAICDEIAFWDAIGTNPDVAILQALRPSMATLAESRLLVISSPYAKFGALYQAYRDYYGRDDAPALIWQAPTTIMNPNITEEFINAEVERDPDAARSEWFAQFREDLEAAFSLESIEQCVIDGRTELLPAQNITYLAFVDPSGGRRDQFTVAIGHRSKESAIIDLVRAWKPPFDPSEVTKQCVETLKPYRLRTVTGDAFAGEWPREQFRKHGVAYQLSEKNRSQLYLEMIPVLNSKRCELPDDRKLIEELRRLERRRGRSGKDSIDHPPFGGSDDVANSVAGVINLIIAKPPISTHAVPTGVGRGIGYDLRRVFGSTVGTPLPDSTFVDEEEPAHESRAERYRFDWGDNSEE